MMSLRNLQILIFGGTPALIAAGESLAQDPRLDHCRTEIRPGGIAAAAEWLARHPSPDVLIVGDGHDDALPERLEHLAEHVEPSCKVIVVGLKDSIALFRQLTMRGVADYLGGHISTRDLYDSLSRLYTTPADLPRGKLVACHSACGGAGGSTFAATIADVGADVSGESLLLDLDLAMGTSALLLGEDVRESVASAMANAGLDLAMLERFMAGNGRVRILSTAGSLRDGRLWNDETVERVVFLARTMAKTIIVDLPRGWTMSHERLLVAAETSILVTTPDLAGLRNARMVRDFLTGHRADSPPKVIVNKVGMAKGKEYSTRDFKGALGDEPFALVPWNPEPLLTAVANGQPVTKAGGSAMAAMRQAARAALRPSPDRAATHRTERSRWPSLRSLLSKPA